MQQNTEGDNIFKRIVPLLSKVSAQTAIALVTLATVVKTTSEVGAAGVPAALVGLLAGIFGDVVAGPAIEKMLNGEPGSDGLPAGLRDVLDKLDRQFESPVFQSAVNELLTNQQSITNTLEIALEMHEDNTVHRLAEIIEFYSWAVGNEVNRQIAEMLDRIASREDVSRVDSKVSQVIEILEKRTTLEDASKPVEETITLYLKRLHNIALQSGLLRIIDPSVSNIKAPQKHITVDKVYISLDTNSRLFRDANGHIEWAALQVPAGKNQSEESTDNLAPLSAMEAASYHQKSILLGDPGSGKTTFLNYLALCLSGYYLYPKSSWLINLQQFGWKRGPEIPLHVSLRHLSEYCGKIRVKEGKSEIILDYIARELERCGVVEARQNLMKILTNEKALVLLDGLDEVPHAYRQIVRNSIESLLIEFPRNHYLVTCRILSYSNPEWKIPSLVEHTLSSLSDDQINRFVNLWYTACLNLGLIGPEAAEYRISDFIEALDHEDLREIASNPMLLTVMAIVHNTDGVLPRQRAKLYSKCIDIMMLRWRRANAQYLLSDLKVDEKDLYRALWKIAYQAHESQTEIQGPADIDEGKILVTFKNYLDSLDKAERVLNYIEDESGILINRGINSDGERTYAFPHRSFQEFLAGCFLASDREFHRNADVLARKGPEWREVLLLAVGQLIYGNQPMPSVAIDAAKQILDQEPKKTEDWQAVGLAGEILLLVGLRTLNQDKFGPQVLDQARERISKLLFEGHLTPRERSLAGTVLGELGDPRPGVGLSSNELPHIDWVLIPAGNFIYQDGISLFLDSFYISRYPITYVQFQAFVDAKDGYFYPAWWSNLGGRHAKPREQANKIPNYPRDRISWFEAVAFCRWLSSRLGFEVRLLTEQEWEKAARGTDGRLYPYGNEFDLSRANTDKSEIDGLCPVGIFPDGASPYGVHGMSGNVWDWTLNEYDNPENIQTTGTSNRVLRGGPKAYYRKWTSVIYRGYSEPHLRYSYSGLRICSTNAEIMRQTE